MSKSFVDRFLKVQRGLVHWYTANHRALPWRRPEPDPYEVWISEVMSQQSTMPTIVRYFEKWLAKFPDFSKFAHATESEVLALWAGLGYYSRARNLFRTKEKIREFLAAEKRWPNTQLEWMNFPGVGPYTAAAVSAIVFNDRVLPTDGNVLRVLSRFWLIPDPLNNSKDRKLLEQHWLECARALPDKTHGPVAQAIMELGSQVCRPQNQALCEICPLSSECGAYQEKRVAELPLPKLRKKPTKVLSLGLIYGEPGDSSALLIRQIPAGKRLEGQWELPQWEMDVTPETPRVLAQISEQFEIRGPVRHAITTFQYEVYRVQAGVWTGELPEGHRYWSPRDPDKNIVLSTLTKKLLLI